MSTTDTTIVDVGTPPTTTTAIGNPACYPTDTCAIPSVGVGVGGVLFFAAVLFLVGATMMRIGVRPPTDIRAKRTDYSIPLHIRNRPVYCRRRFQ